MDRALLLKPFENVREALRDSGIEVTPTPAHAVDQVRARLREDLAYLGLDTGDTEQLASAVAGLAIGLRCAMQFGQCARCAFPFSLNGPFLAAYVGLADIAMSLVDQPVIADDALAGLAAQLARPSAAEPAALQAEVETRTGGRTSPHVGARCETHGLPMMERIGPKGEREPVCLACQAEVSIEVRCSVCGKTTGLGQAADWGAPPIAETGRLLAWYTAGPRCPDCAGQADLVRWACPTCAGPTAWTTRGGTPADCDNCREAKRAAYQPGPGEQGPPGPGLWPWRDQ